MSDSVIKVQGLGKEYRVGKRERYKTLRESLMSFVTAPFRRDHKVEGEEGSERFWALRDVSFEVKRGEVIGIIGRNGAGKSTLLKILSRITDPTEGQVEIDGRIGSLLEVGTGFHPELTGRENVYLNGAILGMRREEIEHKFDEIVAFSEIEKFLDTPVKHYSSGMYMRLAFAVAAHLEPEILIVDEVLAVGDAAFQKKCLGKIGSVAREGRTVLFVSHNMAALAALCSSCVLLRAGRMAYHGDVQAALNTYISEGVAESGMMEYQDENSSLRIKKIYLSNVAGKTASMFPMTEAVRIHIVYEVMRPLTGVQLVCHLWNTQQVHIISSADIDEQPVLLEGRQPGIYHAGLEIPAHLLAPGFYQVNVGCGVPNIQVINEKSGPRFEISAINTEAHRWSKSRQDVVLSVPLSWETERI